MKSSRSPEIWANLRRSSQTMVGLQIARIGSHSPLTAPISKVVCQRSTAALTTLGFARRAWAASGALVALPATRPLNARGQTPDLGELRVDKDIVFGMGGSKTLTLDVYRPLAGTIAKRTASFWMATSWTHWS